MSAAASDQKVPSDRPYIDGSSFGPIADQMTRNGIGFWA